MDLHLKETKDFVKNAIREKWLSDPLIEKFIGYFEDEQSFQYDDQPVFSQNYEVHYGRKLIGDVKVYGYKKDLHKKMAQFLIVLGEHRGKGFGTKVVELLLNKLKETYISVYCYVNRYNIASIKMLQKNGFLIKNLNKNEVILYKTLV